MQKTNKAPTHCTNQHPIREKTQPTTNKVHNKPRSTTQAITKQTIKPNHTLTTHPKKHAIDGDHGGEPLIETGFTARYNTNFL